MIRLLLFLAALALAAYGLTWLAENPGEVTLAWRGVEYKTSLMVALGVVAGLAVLLALAWGVIRFVFRIPSLVSLAAKARRREKGYAALSSGMVAVGSGDARAASRHAAEARKHLGDEPLAKLLRAQAAQLAGDRAGAVAAFREMLEHPQTHALGLRGLHIEARRGGDHEAALEFATRAHKHAALPWAAQAVLDDRAAHGDWAGALAIVESNAAARLIDKPTANRWRAVLKTAMAQELAERDAKAALALAQEACALAPGLVPAAALCGRLDRGQRRLSPRSENSRGGLSADAASRSGERLSSGCGTAIRRRTGSRALARWRALRPSIRKARSPSAARRSRRAASPAARAAVAPLLAPGAPSGRPTARVCLLMADIEEAAGAEGAVREWLARAARAPRDRAWVADGVISDRWAPVSPSGALDAFVWRTPEERLSAPEPSPARAAAGRRRSRPSCASSRPAIAPAPPVASAPKPEPPRGAGTVVLLPSSAPDDPGPHDESERKAGFRLFARE